MLANEKTKAVHELLHRLAGSALKKLESRASLIRGKLMIGFDKCEGVSPPKYRAGPGFSLQSFFR